MDLRARLVVCLAFGLLVPALACADIFAFSEPNGAVVLSNLRAIGRDNVLIRETSIDAPGAGEPVRGINLQYRDAVLGVARTYGVDAALLAAVVAVESGYRPRAVFGKGAIGLMQLMPGTASRYGVNDPYDPLQNLHGGAQYLRDMLNLFDGDINLALAAYNAGENAVLRAGRRVPPYEETRAYVRRVQTAYENCKGQFPTPGSAGKATK
ncbi:transglycosylase [Oxalobacteraceae bacterium OM1]|nr:transglycosylase [Oxalobacteraceae bacterium OM1]